MNTALLNKYNVPAPRYTSYPTVPYWGDTPPNVANWKDKVQHAFAENHEISLYIHLPYCESLCTYCGCHKHITTNHNVELPYIESVLKEWKIYTQVLRSKPVLRELHLGGGTPTFFHPDNLALLVQGILDTVELAPVHDFSFEAHPNSTTYAHLQVLHKLGFNRVSIGVQDFSENILQVIHRFQTAEEVETVVRQARAIGYESINFDLIYGLPYQTIADIGNTMLKIGELKPERIAFYSYAHVPWIKPSQRAYSEADLPTGKDKRMLYESGRALLEGLGYEDIGMDHFALPGDALHTALQQGTMHRNFMGYTPYFTGLCIALGASAISDSWDAFVQNEKSISDYKATVNAGELPLVKGYFLTEEDTILRKHILNLMCRYETSWHKPEMQCDALEQSLERLQALALDGLVVLQPYHLQVTDTGRAFLRNICMALDAHYWRAQPAKQVFSAAV